MPNNRGIRPGIETARAVAGGVEKLPRPAFRPNSVLTSRYTLLAAPQRTHRAIGGSFPRVRRGGSIKQRNAACSCTSRPYIFRNEPGKETSEEPEPPAPFPCRVLTER